MQDFPLNLGKDFPTLKKVLVGKNSVTRRRSSKPGLFAFLDKLRKKGF